MPKLCPQCQEPANDAQQFCVHCGAALSGVQAPDVSNQLTLAPGASRKAPADELIGRVLDGKYQLQERIGVGGMGAVYLARRIHIGDDVAVKVLHARFVTEAGAVERFRREARAAAMLRHPSIVAIYDFGEARGNDPAFIVMELVKGVSLRALLQSEKRLQPARAVALMREICAGVGAAHRHQVVHRDLKPDNVIVCAPEHSGELEKVKVLDFGIAKLRDLTPDQSLTQTGTVLGTPHYMSPEQCRGDALDARSDVYSLGALLYEMIAGEPPFTASTITGVVAKHLTEMPVPIGRHALVSPTLEASIMRALAKEANLRHADATAFARDLQIALQAPTPQVIDLVPERPAFNQATQRPTFNQVTQRPAQPPNASTPTAPLRPPTGPLRPPTGPLRPPTGPLRPPTGPLRPPTGPLGDAPTVPPPNATRKTGKLIPVAHPETLLPSAVESTARQSRTLVYWASVGAAVLVILAGVAGWLAFHAERIAQHSAAATPTPTQTPDASPTALPANVLTTTTLSAESNTDDTPPLDVSRVASAEALLATGETIAEKDVAELGAAELRVLHNTVYARHGRSFDTPGLQRYFSSRSWYKPNPAYSDELLTETDRANLAVLAAAEGKAKQTQATTAHASTKLSDEFAPDNTRDERLDTGWAEGAKGPGVGEWLAFTFKPQTIQYVEIFPGHGKSKELFFANHRLKRATLIFSDGTRAAVQLFDEMRMQTVALPAPVHTSSMRLIVEEVYPGKQSDDLIIAEVNWR